MALIERSNSMSGKDIGKTILRVLKFILILITKLIMGIFYALYRIFDGIGSANTSSDEKLSFSNSSHSHSSHSSKQYYYCKWCGKKETSLRRLVDLQCRVNPYGKCCELYEGSEKSEYTCKWCGERKRSISLLVNLPCRKNPNKGRYGHRGVHEPAL